MAAAPAGGFVAHAAGLRAAYIVAGVLTGAALLAALPVLASAASGASSPDEAKVPAAVR